MRGNQPFSAWVESPEPLVRELWCSFEPDHDLQREADEGMAAFPFDEHAGEPIPDSRLQPVAGGLVTTRRGRQAPGSGTDCVTRDE